MPKLDHWSMDFPLRLVNKNQVYWDPPEFVQPPVPWTLRLIPRNFSSASSKMRCTWKIEWVEFGLIWADFPSNFRAKKSLRPYERLPNQGCVHSQQFCGPKLKLWSGPWSKMVQSPIWTFTTWVMFHCHPLPCYQCLSKDITHHITQQFAITLNDYRQLVECMTDKHERIAGRKLKTSHMRKNQSME